MFFTDPSRVYSQLQGKTSKRSDWGHTGGIYGEKEASDKTNAKWLKDLSADQRDFPEQGPVTITKADIQQHVSA